MPALMESDARTVDGAAITSEDWLEPDGRRHGYLAVDGTELGPLTPAQMREAAAQLVEMADAAEGVQS
ncbi:hypothetical protein [Halopolyspora algeriensis]|uniref:hypothetical protein n=1 Tax=Halopolyspora algeriensis TaxID=1500506 RepID=UPI0011521AA7|nr:hypothetical protein [Halopolyspora algeriensis]